MSTPTDSVSVLKRRQPGSAGGGDASADRMHKLAPARAHVGVTNDHAEYFWSKETGMESATKAAGASLKCKWTDSVNSCSVSPVLSRRHANRRARLPTP
jgi:hypothetical protein